MKKNIAILSGDGIGPEIMTEALRVLGLINHLFTHQLVVKHGLAGGVAYEAHGVHLPEETVALCRASDAILFGSVGGPVTEAHQPKWKNCEANSILALRKAFQFNANFRPVQLFPEVAYLSPLRADVVAKGADILIIRELLGDCYFGAHTTEIENGIRVARDVAEYTETQISSIARTAFAAARIRSKKVCSVHKANVLDTSKLWRDVVREVHRDYDDVILEELLVDNCAMQIVRSPAQFDVIVTTNMFGDILSDIGAVLPGSLGLTPSASFNDKGFGMYEPSGGSAPDIAGKGIANPIAQILSLAMMLKYSFKLEAESDLIFQATRSTLARGVLTADLIAPSSDTDATTALRSSVSTTEWTDALLSTMKGMRTP